ncbi:MAG: hypothetical protein JXB85_18250 [Anaerolineales bacterium]|nr:hypothetical protein [Anaerolineales bacterium]
METNPRPSLYRTVNDAARFLFQGGEYAPNERRYLVDWILAHQNPHKWFIFYPSPEDLKRDFRLFSGEKPRTRLLTSNALELESLRLLSLLDPHESRVQTIFKQADTRLERLCFASVCPVGECAPASIAFLRYLTARDRPDAGARCIHALGVLRLHRDGEGGWQKFPFFFTLLWLTELPADLSGEELKYAMARCEQAFLHPPHHPGPYDGIRERIIRSALDRVSPRTILQKSEDVRAASLRL